MQRRSSRNRLRPEGEGGETAATDRLFSRHVMDEFENTGAPDLGESEEDLSSGGSFT
jgi:hypothetical protein